MTIRSDYHTPKRMFAVATYIVAYAVEHGGNTPCFREVADHFGCSKSLGQIMVDKMYRYGIAERLDGKLLIAGGQYIPPEWYIRNLTPPLSEHDLTDNARHNPIRFRKLA